MNKRFFWILFGAIIAVAAFLRLNKLDQLPPSLYWEEVALGYDAYSIAETGKDHHGNPWPIVAFESFGDWKPSLYFYAIVPFVKTLGLNAWAVRLPSALSGISIVIAVGLLARFFVKKDKDQDSLQLIAMAVTAISPWAVQFSRAGWEVNLATALIAWGVVAFLNGMSDSKNALKWLVGSAVFLVLSMYAYHAARMVAPLLGASLALFFAKDGLKQWKAMTAAGIVTLMIALPLLLSLGSKTTNQRFAETSIFTDLSIIEKSNHLKDQAGNSLLARVFYHRYVLFGREMLSNGLSHFHPNFLFMTGDSNLRHSVQYLGQLYHIEAVLLLLGLAYMLFRWQPRYGLLFAWLLIGIIPASMTKATPHALRILQTLPVFMILISLGIKEAVSIMPKKFMKAGWLVLVLIYLAELTLFWRFYTKVYPKMFAPAWQYGYQQMVDSVQDARQKNPDSPVYITREQGRPAMYFWFFSKTDPRAVQAANAIAKKDQGEFLEFENIKFVNSIFEVVEAESLVVSSRDGKNSMPARIQDIDEISDSRGVVIWSIYKAHKL